MKQIVFLDTEILPSNKDWQKLTDKEILEFAREENEYRSYGIVYNTEKELVEAYNHEYIPTSENWVAFVIGEEVNPVKALKENIVMDIYNTLKESGREGCEFDDFRFTNDYECGGCFPNGTLHALRLGNSGELFAEVDFDGDEMEIGRGDIIDMVADSLMHLLATLRGHIALRNQQMAELRELVKSVGGKISFDGNFVFTGDDASRDMYECYDTKLMGLTLKDDGKLEIADNWDGSDYTNSERFIPNGELDRILDYVKAEIKKRKFTIKASKGMSRTFEIVADSYESALAIAKAEMEKEPWHDGDIDYDEIA